MRRASDGPRGAARVCSRVQPMDSSGTTTMTTPTMRTPNPRCPPRISTSKSTSRMASGSMAAADSVAGLRGPVGRLRRGRKIVSIVQPSPANSTMVTSPGQTALFQLAPGISAVLTAMAKDRGDQHRVERKARWMASSIRRSRCWRISGSGSALALLTASVPSSWIAP